MDDQNHDASKVKTHEEILRLFQELQSVEAKVRNPDQWKPTVLVTKASSQDLEPPRQNLEETHKETSLGEPTGELPQEMEEEHKRSFLNRPETHEGHPERKTRLFGFLHKEHPVDLAIESNRDDEPVEEEMPPSRSTFTLQLDPSGNLVGFPLKKPSIPQERKGWFSSKRTTHSEGEDSEEETEEGFRGKLKHLFSFFRRQSSEDSDSPEGISEKIKGIFRRKNEE
ncbi:MAG: hypothetical protein JXA75_02580 [Candidatus Thermoplasmatota archaeon]|nr:hypothetical protein [Candidatus Thermoplasmatota archaeon]